jgi:hypothetical protein
VTVPELPPAGVHTPAEAIAAGLCPGCLGTGRVTRFVPYEDVFPCSTCEGAGTWPPPGDVAWMRQAGP